VWVKPSAIAQPTRPTQPFIPSGSINEQQAPIRCVPSQLGVAPSGERLRSKKQALCNFQVKLCDPCLSALCVLTWRYVSLVHNLFGAVLRDSLLLMYIIVIVLCR